MASFFPLGEGIAPAQHTHLSIQRTTFRYNKKGAAH